MRRALGSSFAAGVVLAACSSGDLSLGRDREDAGAPLDASASDASPDGPSDGGAVGPASSACSGRAAPPPDRAMTIASGGRSRDFHVHAPPGYDPGRLTAVVLEFHEVAQTSEQQATVSAMKAKSDAEGFLLVGAEGVGKSWNGGICCDPAVSDGVDDVAFVRDMLDAVAAAYCVDPRKVFATGWSNGATLVHRLACDLADRIVAVAPVAGVLGIPSCVPTKPVSVIVFHGTADPTAYYAGVAGAYPSVQEVGSDWAQRDGCTGALAETYRVSDSHCSTYAECRDGAAVAVCTVDGGGHGWPGANPAFAPGYTTPNLSATDMMWSFFAAHPRP